jgi:hypothetical protein
MPLVNLGERLRTFTEYQLLEGATFYRYEVLGEQSELMVNEINRNSEATSSQESQNTLSLVIDQAFFE